MSVYQEEIITAKKFISFLEEEQSKNPLSRYELIDGHIYLMGSPSVRHQRLISHILHKFDAFFTDKPCEVFLSPLDVYLYDKKINGVDKNGALNVFQPDIFVVCNKRKIKSDYIAGAPDLVAEVISRSTSSNDYIHKLYAYMRYGVKEYWIVDYEQDQVMVYVNGKNINFDMKAYKFNDTVKSTIFPGLYIDFSSFSE